MKPNEAAVTISMLGGSFVPPAEILADHDKMYIAYNKATQMNMDEEQRLVDELKKIRADRGNLIRAFTVLRQQEMNKRGTLDAGRDGQV